MTKLHTVILTAATAFAALISGPASADLYIFVNGTQEATINNNTDVSYVCKNSSCAQFSSLGGWVIQNSTTTGADEDFLPEIFGNQTIDVTHSGVPSSLTFEFAETNLTAHGVMQFLSIFGGSGLTGAISATRTFYLDSNNGTDLVADAGFLTQLGTLTTTCVSGTCASAATSMNNANTGSGLYSLIETVTLTSGNGGANLADQINVPEPVSLSLFGSGLIALGALSRRRRPKKAA